MMPKTRWHNRYREMPKNTYHSIARLRRVQRGWIEKFVGHVRMVKFIAQMWKFNALRKQ